MQSPENTIYDIFNTKSFICECNHEISFFYHERYWYLLLRIQPVS